MIGLDAAVDVGFVVGWLLLIALVAGRHYRGELSRRYATLYLGLCLPWLAYGMLQLTQGGPVPTGTPGNYVLDGVAVVLLVGGLYALYRWWDVPKGTENGD